MLDNVSDNAVGKLYNSQLLYCSIRSGKSHAVNILYSGTHNKYKTQNISMLYTHTAQAVQHTYT